MPSSEKSETDELSSIAPVKVFCLDEMLYTPFGKNQRRKFKDIRVVPDIKNADVVVSRKMKSFTSDILALKKWNLIWTHEPYYDLEASVSRIVADKNGSISVVFIFNTHNGLIYTDNYYYAPTKERIDFVKSANDINVEFSDKTMSFAAGLSGRQAVVAGRDRGIYQLRERLALEAHALGAMRIIGKGWPPGISEGDSRAEGRSQSKTLFIKQTNFNFCFENCSSDYYVTEKIWEAIAGGCLPIYYPNSTIDLSFPKRSYIDGSLFNTADDMIAYVSSMSISEYIFRVNKCRKVYNKAVAEGRAESSRQRSVERVLHFLRHAQANPQE